MQTGLLGAFSENKDLSGRNVLVQDKMNQFRRIWERGLMVARFREKPYKTGCNRQRKNPCERSRDARNPERNGSKGEYLGVARVAGSRP
jgi:hypothetical protein